MSTVLWTDSERLAILNGAREAFLQAMLDGYVGGEGRKSVKTVSANGVKTITFPFGDYEVVDRYCVTSQSNCSAGTTTIFYKKTAVWWMSYGGEYPEAVIPFLKKALAVAYRQGEFRGGRGPEHYEEPGLVYGNYSVRGVEPGSTTGSSFSSFQGYEEITGPNGDVLGFHRYFGLALI